MIKSEPELNIAPPIYGTGKITVIINVNLGRFMPEGNRKARDLFRRKRGSEDFMSLLRKLPGNEVFKRLDESVKGSDPWIEKQGYNLGVFRNHLIQHWFFPTFELIKDEGKSYIPDRFKDSKAFADEWNQWQHIKVRITRNGFIQIKLSRKFTSEPLSNINTQLLKAESNEYRTQFALNSQSSTQISNTFTQPNLLWELAYHVIKLFIEQISELKFDKEGTIKLQMPEQEHTVPIRDQYTIIFFKRLSCDENSETKLTVKEIFDDPGKVHCIRSLWDGILLGKPDGSSTHFPEYGQKALHQISQDNQSTFENEFSLIGSERAVIYCPLSTQEIHLPYRGSDSIHGARYNDYWKCIQRGFELILGLRNELQMVESYSTQKMTEISGYTHALTTHGISKQELKDVRLLSRMIANWFKLLVSIRGVLVTPSSFRAGYAIQKFDKLIDVLGIKHIETHVEENIKELNAFVSHFNDLAIQQNGERLQRYAIGFGFLFAFLGVASFLKDAFELNTDLGIITLPSAFQKLFCLFLNAHTIIALGILWVVLIVLLWLSVLAVRKLLELRDNSQLKYDRQ